MENEKQFNRSFVIPVLDFSPASSYNILTLLKDLEDIKGEVIVIFNSPEIAEKVKNHPRINYYAILNENVGVARAWNIGLNIADSHVVFILNSDLHIENNVIENIEKALYSLPDAAIAGPQGAFFNFSTLEDFIFFEKGTFPEIIEVDVVSGFLFAVKSEYFNSGKLKFDNIYTPCYFEERDISMQCRKAGLKCYIVPETDYDHTWGGTIKSLKKIRFMKKELSPEDIHDKNLINFINKWENEDKSILKSKLSEFTKSFSQQLANYKRLNSFDPVMENFINYVAKNLKY